MAMSLKQAQEILDQELQADSNVGLGLRSSKRTVQAAKNVVDYYADKDYNSVEGRIWRAQQKKAKV